MFITILANIIQEFIPICYFQENLLDIILSYLLRSSFENSNGIKRGFRDKKKIIAFQRKQEKCLEHEPRKRI